MTAIPKAKNYSHNGDPLTASSLGNSRDWGDANEHVKFEVQKEIIQQATTAKLPQRDIANLLALAEVESGFNPDAATTSHVSSASGVFAITDSSATDARTRLSGTNKIDGYKVDDQYHRFDTASNVSYGIAVYLDKKKHAHSDDVGDIYKTWNTNPDEYNKYKLRLETHASQYQKDLNNKVWDGPGPAAPVATVKAAEGSAPVAPKSVILMPVTEAPKSVQDILSSLASPKVPGLDMSAKPDALTSGDSPSSRLLTTIPEPTAKTVNKPL